MSNKRRPDEFHYEQLPANHSHDRITFPPTKDLKFRNKVAKLLGKEEMECIQKNPDYDNLIEIHFDIDEDEVDDLSSLFDFFKKRALILSLVQVQQIEEENDLVFIFNIERCIFWIGFYFRAKDIEKDLKKVKNPFVSKLDFSREENLSPFFSCKMDYIGYLFQVCPCLRKQ